MAISERTRKILWVKAGGRCSLCRKQVAGEPTDLDDPSVFGQEAHIIAQKPNGPRAGAYDGDIDGYDNLILLCSPHHKEVDDQVNTYTTEQLRQKKREHEAWVAQLGEKTDPGPTRLIPDPAHSDPKMLKLFTDGTEFWHYFDGCYSFQPSWPAGLGEETEDVIAEFLSNLEDWMDVASGVGASYSEKREASKAMSNHILELAQVGLLLGGKKRHLLLTGGSEAPPLKWTMMVIELQLANLARLADEDGSPLFPDKGESEQSTPRNPS